jgi:hypothetical protein
VVCRYSILIRAITLSRKVAKRQEGVLLLDPSMEEAVDELIKGPAGMHQACTGNEGRQDAAANRDLEASVDAETSEYSEELPDAHVRCVVFPGTLVHDR